MLSRSPDPRQLCSVRFRDNSTIFHNFFREFFRSFKTRRFTVKLHRSRRVDSSSTVVFHSLCKLRARLGTVAPRLDRGWSFHVFPPNDAHHQSNCRRRNCSPQPPGNFRFSLDVRRGLSTRKAPPRRWAKWSSTDSTKPWRRPCGGRGEEEDLNDDVAAYTGSRWRTKCRNRSPSVWTRRWGRGRTLSLGFSARTQRQPGLRTSPGGALGHEFLPKEQLVRRHVFLCLATVS